VRRDGNGKYLPTVEGNLFTRVSFGQPESGRGLQGRPTPPERKTNFSATSRSEREVNEE